MLTETDIDAIRDTLAQATPGPWQCCPGRGNSTGYRIYVREKQEREIAWVREEIDAEVVAEAPENLTLLLDDVACLTAENKTLRAELRNVAQWYISLHDDVLHSYPDYLYNHLDPDVLRYLYAEAQAIAQKYGDA